MKSLFLTALTLVSLSALATGKGSRIPHDHSSREGGLVLMSGDDHLEIKPGTQHNQIEIYLSDKFRKAIPIAEQEIRFQLLVGQQKTELNFQADQKRSDRALLQLPHDLKIDEAQLEITAYRKNPPKGYLLVKRPQSLALSKLFSAGEKTEHDHH